MIRSLSRFVFLLVLQLVVIGLILVQPVDAENKSPTGPLKVGFIYTGTATDAGWNNAHDQGRKYVDEAMKGSVVTTAVERIPESADCERVMEKMIAKGNKVIFATSYGFLEPMLRVAKRHPDVRFMHCGRPVPPGIKNVGSYFSSDYYEILYAAGIVAAKTTKSNKIGYVGGHPIPALLWCMNAFTLGARSVNPKTTVHVVWINSWEDPALEAEAARGLVEKGCDVLVSNLNTSLTVAKTAEKAKVYSVGTNYDLHALVPNGWLTGQSWNWGPMYVKIINSIQTNSWTPGDQRWGLKDGNSVMAPFGKAVPQPVQAQALKIVEQLKNQKLQIFAPPLKDRDGKIRLAVGQRPDKAWLESMDWFVPGIQGTLPKK